MAVVHHDDTGVTLGAVSAWMPRGAVAAYDDLSLLEDGDEGRRQVGADEKDTGDEEADSAGDAGGRVSGVPDNRRGVGSGARGTQQSTSRSMPTRQAEDSRRAVEMKSQVGASCRRELPASRRSTPRLCHLGRGEQAGTGARARSQEAEQHAARSTTLLALGAPLRSLRSREKVEDTYAMLPSRWAGLAICSFQIHETSDGWGCEPEGPR